MRFHRRRSPGLLQLNRPRCMRPASVQIIGSSLTPLTAVILRVRNQPNCASRRVMAISMILTVMMMAGLAARGGIQTAKGSMVV